VHGWETGLGPVLDACAAFGLLRWQAIRATATEVLTEAGGTLSLLDFADRMAEARPGPAARERWACVDDWAERYRSLVGAALVDGQAQLTGEDLSDLAEPLPDSLFVSPDLLIEGSAERGQMVLGEIHPYVYAWGSQGRFVEDPEALAAAFDDLDPWGGADRIATVVRRRQHKGLVAEWFPGRFVEITSRATSDLARRLPVDSLNVTTGPDGPQLLTREGISLVLYSGEEDHPHLQALSPPAGSLPKIRVGDRNPRVLVGRVVVQRAAWRIDRDTGRDLGAACGDEVRLALAVTRLRHASGWPQFLFALAADEPKPICLDLDAPVAWDVLARLAARGPLELVEMRPGPEDLLVRRSGHRYTSEFRVAMFRRRRG